MHKEAEETVWQRHKMVWCGMKAATAAAAHRASALWRCCCVAAIDTTIDIATCKMWHFMLLASYGVAFVVYRGGLVCT